MATTRPAQAQTPPRALALLERLVHHARTRPDAAAIRFTGDGRTTAIAWGELADLAGDVAARLEAQPPATGHALLMAENRIETQAALLGALAAGVSVLPVSPESPEAEWSELAARCDASLLIETAPPRGDARASWSGPRLEVAFEAGRTLRPRPVAHAALTTGGAAGSLLLHSSGTQGATKIVHRPPAALDALARNVARGVGLGPDDVVLITLPLCHSYAIDFALLGGILAGSTLELHERFVPGRAASALATRGVTLWPAVPLMLDAVSRSASGRAGGGAPGLRVISAGSPLPARVREQFESAFGVPVAQLYGASEYGAIAYSPPDAPGFDPECVGRPFEEVTLRIAEPGRSEAGVSLPTGEEGEVWVKSPTALDRYLDAPDRPDPEGFWRSGDLGRLDTYGALRVTGRVKALIDVGGRNVNPLEVESVLARHPDVAEAVVVGIPFSDTASRLKAIVVPRQGRTPQTSTLREFVRVRLAPHKVPRSFELRESLPRSAAGKVLRQELVDQAREEAT